MTEASGVPAGSPIQASPKLASPPGSVDGAFLPLQDEWSHKFRGRSALISLGIVIAAELFWIRIGGYFGFSLFVFTSLSLIGFGVPFIHRLSRQAVGNAMSIRNRRLDCVYIACLTLAVLLCCARMVWQGNPAVATAAVLMLGLLSFRLRCRTLPLLVPLFQWTTCMIDGLFNWLLTIRDSRFSGWFPTSRCLLVIGVPCLIGLAFLGPFVLSHPNLVTALWEWMYEGLLCFELWLAGLNIFELLLLFAVACISFGLLLPNLTLGSDIDWSTSRKALPCADTVYLLIRNSLTAVLIVFIPFLAYEFYSLWSHDFPPGFYYSGYAHQGAAWLTVALAMSTAVLSLMFSPSVHQHTKLVVLQRLATAWLICNVILAIAAYHRLAIYVEFNGMTRMRIVGYFGVTCVLVGFAMVLQRVYGRCSLPWLLQSQVWALAGALYLLSIFPSDWYAHRWNADRIGQGRSEPAVQIAVHPISDEGYLPLFPLLNTDKPILRDGIRALLAARLVEFERSESKESSALGRSAFATFQASGAKLREELESRRETLEEFRASRSTREAAFEKFRVWAMQWY